MNQCLIAEKRDKRMAFLYQMKLGSTDEATQGYGIYIAGKMTQRRSHDCSMEHAQKWRPFPTP